MTTARCLVSLEQIIIPGSLACFAHNVVQPGPFGLGQCRLASRKRSWELIQGSLVNPSSATTFLLCFQQFTRTALCLPTSGLPMDTRPDLHVGWHEHDGKDWTYLRRVVIRLFHLKRGLVGSMQRRCSSRPMLVVALVRDCKVAKCRVCFRAGTSFW